MIRNLTVACCILLLTACTTFGPAYTELAAPGNDEALVYIYRPSTFSMSALTALIDVDGVPAAHIKNGGYAALFLKPGTHTITQQWETGMFSDPRFKEQLKERPVSIVAAFTPGSTFKIRLAAQASGHVIAPRTIQTHYQWQLRLVSGKTAQSELAQCRLADVEPSFQSKK